MRIRFIPFKKLPYSDTCWSLIEGPDERVYIAGCNEHSSGGTVFLVRYNPVTEELEYLLDVAEVVEELPANRRATQCKVHFSMMVDDQGILYAATHLSGPAIDQTRYSPWGTFNDPLRSYIGARAFAYDTRSEKVLWTDTLIPWEGCRCMGLDRKRGLLYSAGYPRNHFYVYDIASHKRRDLGRLGSVNPFVIWFDSRFRAYTTDDYGHIVVYDPDSDKLVFSDVRAACAPYQDGWHSMIYDGVQVPGTEDIVGVTWNIDPYLFRFSPGAEIGTGAVKSLGPASPGLDGCEPRGMNTDHTGGLVFSAAGELFYCVSLPASKQDLTRSGAELKVMNIETGQWRKICDLVDETGVKINYISRAARIGPRHLVMGVVGQTPTGILHVELDDEYARGPWQATPRRYWG
jgi:hypothetical protein